MPQPTLDEFQAWRDSPVSQWVFQAISTAAEAQKSEWLRRSWLANNPDPLALCELRTRADAYTALEETAYEGWCVINGQEPIGDAA